MKRSTSDIVLMIFKIIIFLAISVYLALSVFEMATANTEEAFAGLAFVVLFAVGLYVNGGAFILSLVLLILSIVFKSSFVNKADKALAGYEKCLKIKKNNILHYSLLMAYAVVAEIVIFIVGSAIF